MVRLRDIIIYRQATSAHNTQAEVISKSHDRFYQVHRNSNSISKCHVRLDGRDELIHKYTSWSEGEDGKTMCKTYDSFCKDSPPIPTQRQN